MFTHEQDETVLQLALECLARTGRLSFHVTGSSMLPGIRSGSCIMIRRVAARDLEIGDVVLARTGEGVRLHRLMEIRRSGLDTVWITRGDNKDHYDPPLSAAQILGILIHVEKPERVGWLSRLSAAGLRIARAA